MLIDAWDPGRATKDAEAAFGLEGRETRTSVQPKRPIVRPVAEPRTGFRRDDLIAPEQLADTSGAAKIAAEPEEQAGQVEAVRLRVKVALGLQVGTSRQIKLRFDLIRVVSRDWRTAGRPAVEREVHARVPGLKTEPALKAAG